MASIFDEIANEQTTQPSRTSVFDQIEGEAIEMRPVMGRLKEAEQRIQPESPSIFDRIIEGLGYLNPAPFSPMTGQTVPTTQEEMQDIQRGFGTAAKIGAAIAPRVGVPLAAAYATGGASLIPTVAAVGAAGAAGELAGQGVEMGLLGREEIEPSRMAGAAIRTAVPIFRAGGPITSGAANLAAQTAAGLTAREIEEGRLPTLKEAAWETAFSLPAGAAGYVSAMRGFGGSAPMRKARAARSEIKARTGVQLPEYVGETANDLSVMRGELLALKSQSQMAPTPGAEGAIDFPEFQRARRAVLMSAANATQRGRVTAQEVAKDAVNALEQNLGPLNASEIASVNQLADDYLAGKMGTIDDIQRQLAAVVPGPSGVSKQGIFESIRTAADDALTSAKNQWDELFGRVRSSPLFKAEELITSQNTKKTAGDLLASTIKREVETETALVDQFGRSAPGPTRREPIASALPESTRKWVSEVQQAADTQSLEAMRNFRTKLGYGIDDNNYLPGLTQKAKQDLYNALGQDIEESLKRIEDGLPVGEMRKLASDLRAANKAYSDRVDDFKQVFASGVLKEEGARGAATAEALAGKITGTAAESTIANLKRLLGAKAGPEVEKVKGFMRDKILFDATSNVGTDMQAVSPGKILEIVSDPTRFSQAFVKELYPNIDRLREVATRELKAAGLPSTQEALSAFLQFGPEKRQQAQAIMDAISDSRRPALSSSIVTAIREQANLKKQLKDTFVSWIRNAKGDEIVRNKEDFVNLASGGAFDLGDLKNAMTRIEAQSPVAADNVRFLFVQELLQNASSKDEIGREFLDTAKLQMMLKKPVAGERIGSDVFGRAEAILGKSRAENLTEVAGLVEKAEMPRRIAEKAVNQPPFRIKDVAFGFLVGTVPPLLTGASPTTIAFSAGLGIAGGTMARGVRNLSDKTRYQLAALMISDGRFAKVLNTAYSTDKLRRAVILGLNALELEESTTPEQQEEIRAAEQLLRQE